MTDLSKSFLEGVLVYPVMGEDILLATKTRKIGAGKISGFGGSIEGNETPIECCCRETPEECLLTVDPEGLEKMAEVMFHNLRDDGSSFDFLVHVFFARKVHGTPGDGDGMINPRWHNRGRMPWNQMMYGDRYWLPLILSEKKIVAEVFSGPGQKKLLGETKIKEVTSFD